MNIYLRQANIKFSRHFVDTIKEKGITLTRRNKFFRSAILINHGNSKPIEIGKKVKEFIIINKPSSISYCSDKLKSINLLKEYYPETTTNIDDIKEFPIIAKPTYGHHGYGIEVFDTYEGLSSFLHSTNEPYIFQKFIPIKHEYRFNVFDGSIFQVSHKERIEGSTDEGGFIFSYRSLGRNASISKKFWNWIYNVVDTFHESIGNDLGDYCIDVIKGQDNKYYVSEINSAYGIGSLTLDKLIEEINYKYSNGDLDKYKVR